MQENKMYAFYNIKLEGFATVNDIEVDNLLLSWSPYSMKAVLCNQDNLVDQWNTIFYHFEKSKFQDYTYVDYILLVPLENGYKHPDFTGAINLDDEFILSNGQC